MQLTPTTTRWVRSKDRLHKVFTIESIRGKPSEEAPPYNLYRRTGGPRKKLTDKAAAASPSPASAPSVKAAASPILSNSLDGNSAIKKG